MFWSVLLANSLAPFPSARITCEIVYIFRRTSCVNSSEAMDAMHTHNNNNNSNSNSNQIGKYKIFNLHMNNLFCTRLMCIKSWSEWFDWNR